METAYQLSKCCLICAVKMFRGASKEYSEPVKKEN